MSEEFERPMRGEPETPYERRLFVAPGDFYRIADLLRFYGIDGLSTSACRELLTGAEEAIMYQAVKSMEALAQETTKIVETSASITKYEGRKITTLWDVRRAIRRLFVCPYPWCDWFQTE